MAPHPPHDPARRRPGVNEWPAADRDAWVRALAPGDLLDGTVGPGHHWSADTREAQRKSYGGWLTFLSRTGRLDPHTVPQHRITRAAVGAYIDHLRDQNVASWTLWGRIAHLLAVARAFGPGEDWGWLRRVAGRLKHQRTPARNKHVRLRPATEIFAWACREMEFVRRGGKRRYARQAFRDALMVALLITCPTMRLRNLAMIEIGRHLVRHGDRYSLHFAAREMKGRKPVDIPVPPALTEQIDHYIEAIRPVLAGDRSSPQLWITRDAEPMTEHRAYMQITRITTRAFGQPINPHLFRDCAVTTVALDDPKHIGIAAPILGHTDPRTTEKHYIQAQQIESGRRLRRSLKTLRQEHPPAQVRAEEESPR